MATTAEPASRAGSRTSSRNGSQPPPVPSKPSKAMSLAGQVWEVLRLAGNTFWALVTPPFVWRGEFIDQGWMLAKRVAAPAVISAMGFGYGAPGIQGTLIAQLFGDVTRDAAIVGAATIREQAVWVTGMVMAGVAGTAICADLGARRIRGELEALDVLGVDVIRRIIAPRVLAMIVLMPGIGFLVVVGEYFAIGVANLQFGGTAGTFFEAGKYSFSFIDLIANVCKTTLTGGIIGLVCCYKGMNVSGGPIGVGRAVNQAVVICFVIVWVLNYAFNSVYLSAFPEAQAIK